jgi:hypothetical protein
LEAGGSHWLGHSKREELVTPAALKRGGGYYIVVVVHRRVRREHPNVQITILVVGGDIGGFGIYFQDLFSGFFRREHRRVGQNL